MTHIMLDLETMALHERAPILSIGAVAFTATEIVSEFMVSVSLQSNIDAGRIPDAGTIMWWLGQSEQARLDLITGEQVSLSSALAQFTIWKERNDGVLVWGNGALADNLWIQTAFADCKLKKPWAYKNDRCFRTIVSSFGWPEDIEFEGTPHNPVDDARHQARALIEINRRNNLGVL